MNIAQIDVSELTPKRRALLEKLLTKQGLDPLQVLPIVRQHRQEAELSFAQKRLWFVEQMIAGTPAYHIPMGQMLVGPLNRHAFEAAFAEMIERHETLRTRFVSREGSPVQIIDTAPETPLAFADLREHPPEDRQDLALTRARDMAAAPFDLGRSPLYRACLFQLEDQRHLLVLVMHHIVTDGWSLGIFMRELTELYAAFCRNEPSPLAPLPIQYADFAAWQRQMLRDTQLEAQMSYWLDQLASCETTLQLPTDRARPPLQSYRGATFSFVFPANLHRDLTALSQKHNATLFMTLLAAYQVLLHRYTHQDDLLVGADIANRNRSEVEGLIGFFVNMLVMRGRFHEPSTFEAFLARTRETSLEAFAHQDLPFEKLVESFQPERDLSRHPLFQAAFVLQNAPMSGLDLEGLHLEPFPLENDTTPFDLLLSLSETASGLAGTFTYNADLFDKTTIARMVRHFRNLLDHIARAPQTAIARLELGDGEEHAFLQGLNQTQRDYPRDLPIHRIFESFADTDPQAVAGAFNGRQISYETLNLEANRIANALSGMGVSPDMPVGICLPRGIDMIAAMLGILKAGGAYVPLDPDYPLDRLSHIIENTGMYALVTLEPLLDEQPVFWGQTLTLDGDRDMLDQAATTNPETAAGAGNLAYILFTSGSTGLPKGTEIPHRGVTRLVLNNPYVELPPKPRFAQVATVSFDAATFEIWGALLNGGCVCIIDRDTLLDPASLKTAMAGIDASFLTSSLFNQTVRDMPDAFAGVGNLLVGGEAVDPTSARNALAAGPPKRLGNGYGPTEVTTFAVVHHIRDVAEGADRVPIGKPIANTTAFVLDPGGHPTPLGVPGELWLGGDGLARGYLADAGLTARKFVPDPFTGRQGSRLYRTGDLVRLSPDGTFTFLGRIDQQVKIRGFRIEPGEIERCLLAHAGLEAAVVVTVGEADKRLIAYVVPKTGVALTPEDLAASLARSLPEYMLPGGYVLLEKLPLNANGKLDRKALPDPGHTNLVTAEYVAPRTEKETKMAEIWTQVLQIDDVGIHDNFFDLGGHSLLATQVIGRIHKVFNLNLPLHTIFETPTIAGLVQILSERASETQHQEIIPTISRDRELPLSHAQLRLWFHHRVMPTSLAYNVPTTLQLTGDMDLDAFARAVDTLVDRHEILRTTYHPGEVDPYQVVHASETGLLEVVDMRGASEAETLKLAEAHGQHPFDLETLPLIRFLLIRQTDDLHLFCINIHHIATDGWSRGIFFRELNALYNAYRQGQSNPLPPMALQYADYASWQRDMLSGQRMEELLDYWRGKLANLPLSLDLPSDRPRPASPAMRGTAIHRILPAELSKRLNDLANREQTTLFMVGLAAFFTLMQRITGQDDIAVGTDIANRNHPAIEDMIGFFVNVLVLRGDLTGDPSFIELLDRVRKTTLDAYAHQDMPFEKLVETLVPHRDPSRPPLFQISFGMQNTPGDAPSLGNLKVGGQSFEQGNAHLDLMLALNETPAGLVVSLRYNTDIFNRATVESMAGGFQAILNQIAETPDCRISKLSLLTPGDRDDVLAHGRGLPGAPWQAVHRMLEARVRRNPEATALVCDGVSITFGELDAMAETVARHLAARGIVPGSFVGLCLPRSHHAIVALFAILKAGAAYLPLDPTFPAQRLATMVQHAGATTILTTATTEHLVTIAGTQLLTVESLLEAPTPNAALPDGLTAQHPAYMIFTSGSTGTPKAIVIPHGALANFIDGAVAAYGMEPGDRLLHFISPSFDAFADELYPTLVSGAALVIHPDPPGMSPRDMARFCGENQVTVLHLPPGYWVAALEEWRASPLPASIRLLITGGEASTLDRLAEWFRLTEGRCRFVNAYGPSETTVITTMQPVAPEDPVGDVLPLGSPIPGTHVFLVSNDLEPVPFGCLGELVIGGVGLGWGYHRDPARTAAVFVPDPFGGEPGARLYLTGDLGRYGQSPNRQWTLEFRGRKDAQINLRGFRIEPAEIAEALELHPDVDRAVVNLYRLDSPVLTAHVAAKDAIVEAGLESQLREWLAARLPQYMMPGAFVFLEALPLQTNGKIDFKALPGPTSQAVSPAAGYADPRNPTEARLAEIFAALLERPQIGIHENFFEAGGHSLMAIRLTSRIREGFGMELNLRTLFENPTIATLAPFLEGDRPTADLAAIPFVHEAERTVFPLSFSQQRLWFIEQMMPGNAVYNIPMVLDLYGSFHLEDLEKTLTEILDRHHILRTVFKTIDGNPQQIVLPSQPVQLEVIDLDLTGTDSHPESVDRHVAAETRRPFDLGEGPLIRFKCWRLNPEHHVLAITMHHIVTDGWSMNLFKRELTALYKTVRGKAAASLPKPAYQYGDFSVWQQKVLQGDTLDGLMAYWKHQLEGMPHELELLTDRPRPAVASHRGATEFIEFSTEQLEQLNQLSRSQGATLFMTLLTAYQILLGRYAGADDFAIGADIANRNRVETESMIGFFINMLVLRADLSGDPDIHTLITRNREMALGAFANEDMPFELLVNELQPERDMSKNPLFQAAFVLQNAPSHALELEGLDFMPRLLETGTVQFDLLLSMYERPDGLTAAIRYSTDLFDAATIQNMLDHLANILGVMVQAPRTRLSSIGFCQPKDRETLQLRNRTAHPYPRDLDLYRRFSQQVAATPGATAIVTDSGTLTYRAFDRKCRRMSRLLKAQGVQPGMMVGLCLNDPLATMTAIFGILRAGAAYVPIDPDYPEERIAFILQDTAMTHLVSEETILDRFPAAELSFLMVLDLADHDMQEALLAGEPEDPPLQAMGGDAPAYVMYTSGSTGTPKGVVATHRGVMRLAVENPFLTVERSHRFLQAATFSFDASTFEIFGPLLNGAAVVLMPQHNLELLPHTLRHHRVDVLFLTTQLFNLLVDDHLEALAGLSHLFFGGEMASVAHAATFQAAHPQVKLIHCYGPTESTTFATTYDLAKTHPSPFGLTIGTPIGSTSVYFQDQYGELCPDGVKGELVIGGDGLAQGYLHRPAITAAAFVPDPYADIPGARLYRSGDRGRYLADGTIEFHGRRDHQVKIRGFRIELTEIEKTMCGHAAVHQAIVGVIHEGTQKQLTAWYAAESLEPDQLRQFLGDQLPNYMIPPVIHRLDEFPLNANGKIDRRALFKMKGPEDDEPFAAPESAEEMLVASVWRQVLGKERIGIHDNFFELGGDSLLSIKVKAKAAEMGFHFELQHLFEHPTIAQLVPFAKQNDGSNRAMPEAFDLVSAQDRAQLSETIEDAYPLSHLQWGMLFHSQAEATTYHDIIEYRVRLPFDRAAFQATLASIASRHPILRTAFNLTDYTVPLQLVHRHAAIPFEIHDLRGRTNMQETLDTWRAGEMGRAFDLGRAPLFHAFVHLLDEETFQVTFSFHHAILDGWSEATLFTEFLTRYMKGLEGRTPPSPAQPPAYRLFIDLEQRAVQDKACRAFWKSQFQDYRPGNLARIMDGHGQDDRLARLPIEIDQTVSDALFGVANTLGLPIKSVVLAIHLKALAVFCNDHQTVTGLVSHGRPEIEGADATLGLFLNTLPMRLPSGAGSWRDLIQDTFKTETSLLTHRRFPLTDIMGLVGNQFHIDVAFNFTNFHVYQNLGEDVVNRVVLKRSGFAKTNFPLSTDFAITLVNNRLIGNLEYNPAKFSGNAAETLVACYQRVMNALIQNPDASHHSLHFLPSEDQAILNRWQSSEPIAAEKAGIHLWLSEVAARTPNATAIESRTVSLSYGELEEETNRLAHGLCRLNLPPERPVAVLLPRGARQIMAFIAVLKSGRAYLPLDPDYPEERLRFMLEDSGAVCLVTEHGMPLLDAGNVTIFNWEPSATAGLPARPPILPFHPGQAAYIIYTSGSSGTPKGVVVSHRAVTQFVASSRERYRFSAADRVLQFFSPSFDGAVEEIFTTLLSGATVVPRPPGPVMSTSDLLDFTLEKQLTVLDLPTAYWHQWTRELALAGQSLPGCLRLTIIGGEYCDPRIYRTWTGLHDHAVTLVNSYGPTEATVVASAFDDQKATRGITGQVLPIGKPLANYRIHILGAHLQQLPIGVVGELYISGPCLAQGYLHRPGTTAAAFLPNPHASGPDHDRLYRTGDTARFLDDGNLQFITRTDRMIKYRGFRIEPGEIEAALGEIPEVDEVIVALARDESQRPCLTAYLVASKTQADRYRQALSRRLPHYLVPEAFVFLSQLPLSPNGKVDIGALPMPSRQQTRAVPPETDGERRLAELWCKTLGVEKVGRYANFFELGGNSLLVLQLVSLIEREWQTKFTIANLYAHPTLHEMALHLERQAYEPVSDLIHLGGSGAAWPVYLFHPVGGQLHEYQPLVRELSKEGPVYGLQSQTPKGPIPQQAKAFKQDILDHQPEGPYFLAGWSFGGMLAFEVACQLEAEGHSVEHVLLIDASLFQIDIPVSERSQALLQWFLMELLGTVKPQFKKPQPGLPANGDGAMDRPPKAGIAAEPFKIDDALRQAFDRLSESGALPSGIQFELFRSLFLTFENNTLVANDYVPKRSLNAPVTLVRALDTIAMLERQLGPIDHLDSFGWRPYCAGPLSLKDIPGHHREIFTADKIPDLATWIKEPEVQQPKPISPKP